MGGYCLFRLFCRLSGIAARALCCLAARQIRPQAPGQGRLALGIA